MDRMLSKIAFSILLLLQFAVGQNPLSIIGESVNPIESLFGSGYICLHISDPQFESSPSFQALARELAKKYNKTPIVHKIGSNETDFPHPHGPETVFTFRTPSGHEVTEEFENPLLHGNKLQLKIHFPVESTTTVRPSIANLVKEKALKCTKEGFFPNPKNCTKFFRCVEPVGKGKPWQIVEFDCGPGTIYDEKISTCNHPEAVNPKPACWNEHEYEEGMKGLRGQKRKTTTTTTPAPDFKEDYAKPDEEEPVPQRPDETQLPDGQIPQLPDEFHPGNLPPGEPIDEGTIERDSDIPPFPEENLCETPGVFADNNNCSHYYQCIRDAKGTFNMIWRNCPHGEIFDAAEEECRRPQEVNPKPECWHKVKHVKKVIQIVNQVTEITEDHEAPPPPEDVDSVEHFDEFESSGTTQVVVTPGRTHIKKTVVNTTEDVEEVPGTIKGSEKIKGKKSRITIPKAIGPKPIPQCSEEGLSQHPSECSQYIKCVKKGKTLKLYFFPCLPAGTVFDQVSKQCMAPELIKPIPPVPDCVEWDDTYRPIFEDLLNEEVDEEEEPTTEKPDEEYEDVLVDDGKGGKKLVRRKKIITIETTEIEQIEGDKEPSHDLGGKKRVDKYKETGHHRGTTEPPMQTVTVVNTTTIKEIVEEVDSPDLNPDYGPPPVVTEEVTVPPAEPEPEQELVTYPPPPPTEEDQKMPCEDEAALVEKLKRENTECEKRVAELEKQNSKMDSQIKRMQKDLGIAKKDKQKYENYIASMDKTIDSYKEEVAWYLQHCPQPTEFIEDEENAKSKRRRRSIEPRVTPVESVRGIRKRFKQDEWREVDGDPEEVDSPRKHGKFQPRPSEGVDSYDDSFLSTGLPSYDENEEEEIGQSHQKNHNRQHYHHNNHERSSAPGGRQGQGHHSHWSPESLHDGKFLLAEIPFLIFGTLTILLITISLLGCLVVRRLNRMTTFSVTPDEFNSSSSFRRKFASGGRSSSTSSVEKLGHV